MAFLIDPTATLTLIGALAFLFACGFTAGRLSTKYRR